MAKAPARHQADAHQDELSKKPRLIMSLELLHVRSRVIAIGGTGLVHLALLAALLSLGSARNRLTDARAPELIAVPLIPPSPSPPLQAYNKAQAAVALRSGADNSSASAAELVTVPLSRPVLVEPTLAPGAGIGSGSGEAAVDAFNNGDEGSGSRIGSGSGNDDGGGNRSGSAPMSPPVRLAGALNQEDYRRANAPHGASGVVVVSFRVRTDGGADNCEVLRSSGYSAFDTTTCRLIEQRFVFQPARDATGREVEWEIVSNYLWLRL